MASLAGATEAALMRIVRGMAADAGRAEHDARADTRAVTGVAVEALVSACQRKLRLPVVLEAPVPPAVRVVAESAGGPEPADVVAVLVAALTGPRCIFE